MAAVVAAALVSCVPEQANEPPRIAANQITIFDSTAGASAKITALVPLQIGDVRTLSVEVLPADATDKAVTWSSSDASIVAIDASGTLEAKASGNAIITVSAGDAQAALPVSVAYSVTSEAQLRDMAQNLAGYYVLKNDIPLTQEWTPLGEFTGTLDGAGFSVKGLWINKPSQSYVGLIEDNKGTIRNIGVELAQQGVIGGERVGALVGYNYGYASGSVTGTGKVLGTGYTGGLVGVNSGTLIGYATVAVEGKDIGSTGGLVGQSTGGLVVGYATSAVSGPFSVGGLVGFVGEGTVIGYSRGTVTGTHSDPQQNVNLIGGFIGSISGGTISGYARGAVSTDREGFSSGKKETFVGPAVGRAVASVENLYYSGKSGESVVTAPTGVTPNNEGTGATVAAGDDSGVLAARFINLSSAYWLFSAGKWPAIDFPADQSIFDDVRGDKQPIAP